MLITSAAPPPNGRPGRMSMARRREAQIAYESGAAPAAKPANADDYGIELRAKGVESAYGPTLLLAGPEEEPAAPMFLLSAGLLRRLVAVARAMGPPRPAARRERSRIDITC
jgi:hypothetical protein